MGRVLAKRALQAHIDHPAHGLRACGVKVAMAQPAIICVEYVVIGDVGQLIVPTSTNPERTDGLWQSTCFEMFVGDLDEHYVEYNFAPSGQWAAYGFSDYRSGMYELPMAMPPVITCELGAERLAVTVQLAAIDLTAHRIGLSAVLAEADGTKSYWALRHPPGKPDFHHPDCFALSLAAPKAP